MKDRITNTFEKLNKVIRTLGDTLSGFSNVFENVCHVKLPKNMKWTNYKCTSCGCGLIIKEHDHNMIYYECAGCGKIHKAYKNNIYRGFKIN